MLFGSFKRTALVAAFTSALTVSLVALAAEPIRLFPPLIPGQPSSEQFPFKNYDALIAGLKSGDQITFEDGSLFEFLDRVGNGKTCHVLKVRPVSGPHAGVVMALRIPIKGETLKNAQNWDMTYFPQGYDPAFSLTFSYYIDYTLKHAAIFESAGFGPKIYQSFPGQYIALELIDRKFSLGDFLAGHVTLTPREMGEVEDALLLLVRQTAGLSDIKDIGQPGQVLYDGKRFVLVDWYGVRFVESTFYPWGFYDFEGPIEELLQFKQVDRSILKNESALRSTQDFQKRLAVMMERERREWRLNMMEDGVNPLSGEPAPGGHSFWQRNFGSWRKVYRDLKQTREKRACNRLITRI